MALTLPTAYATYSDYQIFLSGRDALIPSASFPYYAIQATILIQKQTGGVSDNYSSDDNVIMCCIELAEALYRDGLNSQHYGMTSETVGNHSVTYATANSSSRGSAYDEIFNKYLYALGLNTRRIPIV